MEKFSIVFQGIFTAESFENLKAALSYSDDVILSTWKSKIDEYWRAKLVALGIVVLETDDPGSIRAYMEFGQVKRLNINRMLSGLQRGARVAKHDIILKCRLDMAMDFDRFVQIYRASGRRFASLNVTTVCPSRVGAPPFPFHVSDWAFAAPRCDILAMPVDELDENKFRRARAQRFCSMFSFTRLSAEQILTLILTKKYDILATYENSVKISADTYQIHDEALKSFANVDRAQVGFKPTFYQAKSTQWIMYEAIDFTDASLVKWQPTQLVFFFMSNIFKKLGIKYGARFK